MVDPTEGSTGGQEDPRRAAADLMRNLLDALPPAGRKDVSLRRAVEQRAEALDDVVAFEVGE